MQNINMQRLSRIICPTWRLIQWNFRIWLKEFSTSIWKRRSLAISLIGIKSRKRLTLWRQLLMDTSKFGKISLIMTSKTNKIAFRRHSTKNTYKKTSAHHEIVEIHPTKNLLILQMCNIDKGQVNKEIVNPQVKIRELWWKIAWIMVAAMEIVRRIWIDLSISVRKK